MKIVTLTQSDIDDYENDGYDASRLVAGMKVLDDVELYLTKEEIEFEVWELRSSLSEYNWVGADDMWARVEMLESALQSLEKNF